MSIKSARTGSPVSKLSMVDSQNLTFPNSDWAVGCVVIFGETATPASTQSFQCLFRTAADTSYAGSVVCNWQPPDAGTNGGKFYFYVGSTTPRCYTPSVELGKAYVLVLQRVSGGVVSKLCPLLSSAPANGDAVLSSTVSAFTGTTLDGQTGLTLFEGVVANRRFEHSATRFFRLDRALTDLEIAQLAYGKEITQFASPVWYLRMNDVSDYVDQGSQANVVTAQGSLSTGPSPNFAYTSVPSAPIFSGYPAINGSAVVGTEVTYTPASASGNPFPTVTRQWTISTTQNGVQSDISGATGKTYVPISSDANKFLRVRETATNGVGNPAVVTSSAVVVSNSAVSVSVDELTAEKIFQRIGGAAAVSLSGSYVGNAPARLEYQLYSPSGDVVYPWAPLDAVFGAGSRWSATESIPAPTNGKKYKIAVRSLNSGDGVIATSPITINRFGVGDVIVVIGSSSPMTWFGSGSGSGLSDADSCSNVIDADENPMWATFGTAGRAGQMATYIANILGVPVAMVGLGVGGSSLNNWQDTTSGLWASFLSALSFVGGKLGGVFGAAGSNDVTDSNAAKTVDAHLTKLRNLKDNLRAATGQSSLPILWSGINRRGDALDLQATNARTAEKIFGDDAGVYHVQIMDVEVETNADGSGGVHPTGAGYAAACARYQRVWASALTGTYIRGPKITAIQYSDNTITVSIQHRNGADILPTSGIKGFNVSDSNDELLGPLVLTSIVRQSPTQIKITCDRNLANPKVTYLSGAWPISNEDATSAVFDTGTTPLPMVLEAFMPATPNSSTSYTQLSKSFTFTYSIAEAGTIPDTTNPVIPGTLTTSSITTSGFTVAWSAGTDNVGVTGYEVSADTGTESYTDVGNVTSRNVTGLNPATTYNARVRAYDAAGNKSTPLTTTVTTLAGADTTAPSLSGVITTSSVSTSGFTFAWPAATDNVAVTGYEYSVDTGTASYTSNGTSRTKTVSGLASDTYFTLRVRAFDAAGNRSNVITTTVKTDALPAGPSVVDVLKNTSAPISITPTVLSTTPILVNYRGDLSQDIFMYNKSASAVVVTIKGSDAGNFEVPKAAGKTLDLSTGLQITVNANSFSVFELDNARAYFDGTVTMSASTGSAVSVCVVS